MKRSREAGQAGLIVMLVMVVLLTLGVSIATRSTQDVTQSRQEEETSRVFDAAEAGIEEALAGALGTITGTSLSGLHSDLSATYSVEEVSNLEAYSVNGGYLEISMRHPWSSVRCMCSLFNLYRARASMYFFVIRLFQKVLL